jgi:hypothetical protein
VSLDFSRQDVLVLTVDSDMVPDDDPFNPAIVVGSAFPGITPFKPQVEQQEPLKAELSSFLAAVRARSTPVVSLDQGRKALAVALEIVDAIAAHSHRARLDELTGGVS